MDLDQYAAYVTSVVLTNEYAQAALNSDIYESVSENLPFAAELAKVVAEVVPEVVPVDVHIPVADVAIDSLAGAVEMTESLRVDASDQSTGTLRGGPIVEARVDELKGFLDKHQAERDNLQQQRDNALTQLDKWHEKASEAVSRHPTSAMADRKCSTTPRLRTCNKSKRSSTRRRAR